MMRAPAAWAVAVRRPDGVIEAISHDLPRLTARSKLAKVPLFRGVMVLIESLQLGFKALSWSAEKSGEEDEEISKKEIIGAMVFAVFLAIGLFAVLPVVSAKWLAGFLGDGSITFVVIDGIIRIGLIVGYVWLISRSKDIQRVFQYHGAEHKTIHAYENGRPLDVESIQEYSPRHPRCGTSFLIIVGVVAFFVFLSLAELPFAWQVASRVLLVPLIAGLSYEVLKAAAGQSWMAWASRPGMWVQAITTKEPDNLQVEVAIASLLAALTENEVVEVKQRGAVAPGALAAEFG
ncbi:MAG: DUF1385 domain-containing protein [Acidimicrobiia bacterium]|nr:DUF1385 domain-containing protein [Acidimicrobiia bacterium]